MRYVSFTESVDVDVDVANSKGEAHEVMFDNCESSLADEYSFTGWEELPDVEYHGESPKILAENGYTE